MEGGNVDRRSNIPEAFCASFDLTQAAFSINESPQKVANPIPYIVEMIHLIDIF